MLYLELLYWGIMRRCWQHTNDWVTTTNCASFFVTPISIQAETMLSFSIIVLYGIAFFLLFFYCLKKKNIRHIRLRISFLQLWLVCTIAEQSTQWMINFVFSRNEHLCHSNCPPNGSGFIYANIFCIFCGVMSSLYITLLNASIGCGWWWCGTFGGKLMMFGQCWLIWVTSVEFTVFLGG